jgi:hypothetical protein
MASSGLCGCAYTTGLCCAECHGKTVSLKGCGKPAPPRFWRTLMSLSNETNVRAECGAGAIAYRGPFPGLVKWAYFLIQMPRLFWQLWKSR